MAVRSPFGDGLQTYCSGGRAVEKGTVTWRRRRFRLLLVVALIITGTVETSGFIMIPDAALNWAIEQLHVLQKSLHLEDGVGVKQVCNTSDCIHAADHLLLGMNQNANPCDDFYEYACGNWAKFSRDQGLAYNNHYEQIRTSEIVLVKDILLRQPDSITFEPAKAAALVYRQCIHGSEIETRDNIKTIIGLTAKLGGWPSLEGSDWNENAFDLVTSLAFSVREYFVGIFFQVALAPHGDNETNYVIQISEPTLPSKAKLGSKSYKSAFTSYYANALCEVIGHKLWSRQCNYLSSRWSSLRQDADDLIFMERFLSLAAIPQKPPDNTNTQEIFTVEEFQKYFDTSIEEYPEEYLEDSNTRARISWKDLLNKIFGPLGVEINDSQVVIVANPRYFLWLARILATRPKRELANYVLFSLAFNQLLQASGKIYELATQFSWLTGLPVQSREDYCLSTTLQHFAVPVMHEYLKTKSNLEGRDVLEKMGENFRATFDKLLEKNIWLNDATKLAVRQKLGVLKFDIGYPSWLLNGTEIPGGFEGRHIGSNSIEMLGNVIKTDNAEYFRNLGKSPTRAFDEPWFRWRFADGLRLFYKQHKHHLSDVTPLYYPDLNSVFLPMGFIQPHQIYSNVPSYLIYSRAGVSICHEILQGFDAGSSYLDENGQKHKSWTAEYQLKYKERSVCYKDQYNKFELFSGMYPNGSFGLNENIADNDGLKLAYITYNEQLNARGSSIDHQSLPGFETFSTEQMFFLSYSSMWCQHADEESQRRRLHTNSHSPPKFRVNGALQNLPEFAHAWNCPTGAPMNPVNKCTLW